MIETRQNGKPRKPRDRQDAHAKALGTLDRIFWTKVQIDPANNCWMWTGRVDGSHMLYGQIKRNEKRIKAHRHAWTLANGPIPDGLFVLHRCDRPLCINPSHLFLGTQHDNLLDAASKGRLATQNPIYRIKIAQGVKAWADAHPERAGAAMAHARLSRKAIHGPDGRFLKGNAT